MVTGNNIKPIHLPELAISYKDSSLHENNMQHSFLVFSLSDNTLKASIIEKKNNRVVFFQEYQNFHSADFSLITEKEKIYQSNFLQSYIAIQNSRHTLVPKQFFSQEKQNSYLEFNSSKDKDVLINNDYLPKINAYNIYENEFVAISKLTLSNSLIMHQNSYFINFCDLISKQQKAESLFISLHKNYFTLIVYSNKNELLLSNSFEYKNHEDIAYHFFYSVEKLGINIKDSFINIYRNGYNADKLINIIDPFVKKIGGESNPLKLNFSKVIPQEIIQSEYLLLTQHLCA